MNYAKRIIQGAATLAGRFFNMEKVVEGIYLLTTRMIIERELPYNILLQELTL